jgi:hypothetical protein
MSYKPTPADILTFKRVERMRKPLYGPATAQVRKYLKTVQKRAAKAYTDTGGDTIATQRAASDPALVADTLARIWYATAPKFGNATQAQIRRQAGQKAMTKNVSADTWIKIITAYLLDQGAEHVTGIDATTVKAIAKVMVTGLQEGWSIPQIAASLTQDHPFLDFARATLIARTEVIGASNWGSLQGARRMGSPSIRKYWIPTLDGNTRDDHVEAGIVYNDNNTIALDDSFTVGGEELDFPGDPGASAGNICNCRCTVGYRSGLLDALQ